MRRRDDEKEKRIKDAVIELMLEEGFHGTSISKIARKAEVSPATVYIYYESKEDMLQNIYLEYSEEVYDYLLARVRPDMDGFQLIETLIREFYAYMLNHQEAFSFVEQFSGCPALSNQCTGKKGICHIFELLSSLKETHVVKPYSDEILSALIFSPVKTIATDRHKSKEEQEALLEEMIQIVQDAILI